MRDFSVLHSIHTVSGIHPASCPVGVGAHSPEVRLPGLEDDHSVPSCAEVKNVGAVYLLPLTSSWCDA
jgi:hypothetical protein